MTPAVDTFSRFLDLVTESLTDAYVAYRRTLVVSALSSAGVTDLEDDPLAWEPVRPVGPIAP